MRDPVLPGRPLAALAGWLALTAAAAAQAPAPPPPAAVRLEADRTRVYLMQPFTITLVVEVRELPETPEGMSPVEMLREPPALFIPWATDDRLDPALVPARDWRAWLGAMRAASGFAVNNIGEDGAYAARRDQLATFLPPRRRVERPDASGAWTTWRQYFFRRTFRAQSPGTYAFGPASLQGVFLVGYDQNAEPAGSPVRAETGVIRVSVLDAPEQGRPESYVGAIGRFAAEVDVTPREAVVGDPLTLTIRLRGQGALEDAQPPDLRRVPGVPERFRIYEAGGESEPGERRFLYIIRPLTAEADAFPSVEMAYFDVERERYVTLHTPPVPLDVRPAEQLEAGDIELAGDRSAWTGDVGVLAEGVFADKTVEEVLTRGGVRPLGWVILWAALAGSYVLAALAVRRGRRRERTEASRRRRAAAEARRRLAAARQRAREGAGREAARAVSETFALLAASLSGAEGSGWTAEESQRRLGELGADPQLLAQLDQLSRRCDQLRFAPGTTPADGLADEAGALLDALLADLKRKGRLG